ncbi:MAG: GNAT family N-acetyltransferase [Flavobacteriales bacterium]|nr:GNAT family N-acetyltransferase [Flavobacteriales bacterium]
MLKGFGEIKLVSRDEIQTEKWEAVSADSDNSIFQSFWYLDAVMENWKAYILNDYELVFPILPAQKMGINYGLQALFLRSFSVEGKAEEKKMEFLTQILEKFHFFELNFVHQTAIPSGIQSSQSVYQFLEFEQDYLLTFKKYSENTRRKLKDFQKSKAEFKEISDVQLLIDLFQKEKGNQFAHLTTSAYQRLTKLMKNALENNAGIIKAIAFEGELVAIGFFIKKGKQLLYLKGIVTSSGKKIGAMQALFDRVIQENHGTAKGLDFGGSSDEGLASFNKKFGACDRNYLILKQNKLPWPLNNVVKRKLGI